MHTIKKSVVSPSARNLFKTLLLAAAATYYTSLQVLGWSPLAPQCRICSPIGGETPLLWEFNFNPNNSLRHRVVLQILKATTSQWQRLVVHKVNTYTLPLMANYNYSYQWIVLLCGGPSFDDLLNVVVDSVDVVSSALHRVDDPDDGLALRCQPVDWDDTHRLLESSAGRVVARQVDQEVRHVPFLLNTSLSVVTYSTVSRAVGGHVPA